MIPVAHGYTVRSRKQETKNRARARDGGCYKSKGQSISGVPWFLDFAVYTRTICPFPLDADSVSCYGVGVVLRFVFSEESVVCTRTQRVVVSTAISKGPLAIVTKMLKI